jgi:biopolymer transport protein ExbD
MEEHRAEDQAEALEPVQIDFTWKRRPEDGDEDVDMIPLIDISLVLLIFFMMTAAVAAGLADIDTPKAKHKVEMLKQDMKLWIGVDVQAFPGGPRVSDKTKPYYSLGVENHVLLQPTRSQPELIQALKKEIQGASGKVKVRIKADQSLPVEVIKNMTVLLKNIEYEERARNPAKQVIIMGEVREVQ